MKNEIIKLLKDCPDYLSGQVLCEHFGVSRTAIWKAIRQLQVQGYDIEAVRNRGYRLKNLQDVLNQKELEDRLKLKWIAKPVYFKEETGSTNNDVKLLAENGAPHGTMVTAAMQSAGKGRRDRVWKSPAGTTIAMSVLLRPKLGPDLASMVTLIQAHAIVLAIEEVCGLQAQIKWPNDVVVNGRKVCGILTEMSVSMGEIDYVIVGSGINVNMDEFPEELSEVATSLKLACGHPVSRLQLIESILTHFEQEYDRFEACGDLSFLKESYEAHMVNKDREVRVLDPKEPFEGIARGINTHGELLVEKGDGTIEAIYAGEVSVRGLYGYV